MPDTVTFLMRQHVENLAERHRSEFEAAYEHQRKHRGTAFLLSFFLGVFAADRFYLGQTRIGLAKLFLGPMTCFLWQFLDLFLILHAVDVYNAAILEQLKLAYPGPPKSLEATPDT